MFEPIIANPLEFTELAPLDECKYIVFGIYSDDERFTKNNDNLYHCIFIRSVESRFLLPNAIYKINGEYRFSSEEMDKLFKPMVNDTRKSIGKIFQEYNYSMKNIFSHFTARIIAFVSIRKEKNEQELKAYNYLKSLGEHLLNARIGGKNTTEYNKKLSETHIKKIPIKNITTGEIFDSLAAAEKKYNNRHIIDVLLGRRDIAADCEWEYVDHKLNIEPNKIREERHKKTENYTYKITRSVFDITNLKLYRTSAEAERILGVNQTSINRSCDGERPIVANRRWVWVTLKEYENYLGKEDKLYELLEVENRLPAEKEISLDVEIDFELNSGDQESLFVYGIITDLPELQTELNENTIIPQDGWQFIYVGITNNMEDRFCQHQRITKIHNEKRMKDYGLQHFKMILLDNFTANRKIGILIEQKYTYYIYQMGYRLINGKFGNKFTKNIRDEMNKDNHPARGHSQEERIKQARIMTKRHIRCIETNEVFQSLLEANLFLGHDKSHIVDVLNGNRPMCNGYHWEYADEQGLSKSREHYNLEKIGYKNGISPVLNIDEDIAYPSVKFAAEQNYLNTWQITYVCNDKENFAINKYEVTSRWRYITKDEYVEYVKKNKAEYPSDK